MNVRLTRLNMDAVKWLSCQDSRHNLLMFGRLQGWGGKNPQSTSFYFCPKEITNWILNVDACTEALGNILCYCWLMKGVRGMIL